MADIVYCITVYRKSNLGFTPRLNDIYDDHDEANHLYEYFKFGLLPGEKIELTRSVRGEEPQILRIYIREE